ncbi:MAG: hypothetical protein DME19_03360 [Verrucomicrobia bacterium]|nr:MAG: hypothetical protein DME19_03360 [Verrucomicrobiota bacterium]
MKSGPRNPFKKNYESLKNRFLVLTTDTGKIILSSAARKLRVDYVPDREPFISTLVKRTASTASQNTVFSRGW